MVDTFGTGKYDDEKIAEAVNAVFDLRPSAIIDKLDLRRPIYKELSAYGHMGRTDTVSYTHLSMKDRHLPHGCANAIYLPYVIKYNAHDQRAAERYADIARMLGLSGNSNKGLIESLCGLIDKMNDELNIPHTLKEFGVDEAEFNAKVDEIAVNAVGDACTGSNPRAIDPETMAKLFKCTYYGTEVDF